jgi:hypothetical protein
LSFVVESPVGVVEQPLQQFVDDLQTVLDNMKVPQGASISSGHRPNEEEEAKFIEWDDFVQVRSFRPRFKTSRLFGWEKQKQVSIPKLDCFRKSRYLGEFPSKRGDIVRR